MRKRSGALGRKTGAAAAVIGRACAAPHFTFLTG
jgi:hypothetical protein